jgi:uncharacterized protein
MARAGRLLDRPDFIASAERALDLVRRELWRDGKLLAVTKDGRAHLNGYLDDHAFLVDALFELLQARWRTEDLEFAHALARRLLDRFEDKTAGGFYFTADDHERLVHRPKPTADEALPSGNGVAAQALQRIGYLLGELDFLNGAERAMQSLTASASRYPSAHASLLIALQEHLQPPRTVVLRGAPEAFRTWQTHIEQTDPYAVAFAVPDNAGNLPALLAERKNIARVTAYVCFGHTCQPPLTNLEEFQRLLEK